MNGRVDGIWRHPVKGLTPEPVACAELTTGAYFPGDRCYAIEVGPSGFDPAHPAPVPKQRFAVLARFPSLARVKTRLDDRTGVFHLTDAHGFGVETRLDTAEGREGLAAFLQAFLGEEVQQRLRVLESPAGHRFMDHPAGYVSLVNLASVLALSKAIGQPVDPLRFRANLYINGLAAWAEDDWVPGARLRLGEAEVSVFRPIVRCRATEVDLSTGQRDIDILEGLRKNFSRDTLGTYVSVSRSGRVAIGDGVGL